MALRSALAIFCAAVSIVPAAAQEARVVLQDLQPPYYRGSYSAYASPWSTFFDKRLIHGTDYLDTITIRPSTFPDDTVIETRWPVWTPAKGGVWGYHALSYGNYDGGTPPQPIPSRQVKDIRDLRQEFRFSYQGSANFNLLSEFYLTSRQGDATAKVIEIGFLLHASAPGLKFFNQAKPIGDYVDSSGRTWKIALEGTFCMIMPADRQDILQGTIDLRDVLDVLRARGVIKGTEWFNGIAFGVEPTVGGGRTSVRIARWRVSYE